MPTDPTLLCNLPLWRLIVALDDAERAVGPDSITARLLARVIQQRLRGRQRGARPRREETSRE